MMHRLPRAIFVAATVGVACLLLGACAGGSGNSSETTKAPNAAAVTVKDFAFGPKETHIRAGGTVTWTNKDGFDHSIQADSAGFDGPHFGPQTAPASYSHRFSTPGTYSYICGIHNSMTGTVIVTK